MLTMRWQNGRIKYSYQPKKQTFENDTIDVPPIPYVSQPGSVKKISVGRWYHRHHPEVDNITDAYLQAFYIFQENNPAYHVYIDESMFRQYMADALYNSSHNALKNCI